MVFFFFNDTATTEIYTLSLHDALPIWRPVVLGEPLRAREQPGRHDREHGPQVHQVVLHRRAGDRQLEPGRQPTGGGVDRKSTRLNSSHANISYAVFCLKKKRNLSCVLP